MQAKNVLRHRMLRVVVGVVALGAGALVAVGGDAGAVGGTNLLSNPGFEGTGSGALTGWAGTTASAISLVSGGAASGSFSAKVSYNAATTGAFAIYSATKPAKAIPKGEVFMANAKLRVPTVTGKPICLQLLEQNATSTVQTVSKCVTPTGTGWLSFPQASITVSASGNSLKAQVRQASGAPGHSFQVDDVSVVDPDLVKPSVPTNVKAVANSATKVTLSWTASTDTLGGVVGYKIYRNHRTSLLANVKGVTSFVDTTVTEGNKYSYQVLAYDFAGNTSALSLDAKAVTPWVTTPVGRGYWPMDELSGTTMNDTEGVSPGTLQNVRVGVPGWSNTAYRFDGTSSQVIVANDSPLNPGAHRMKMGMRVKTTTVPATPDYDLFRKGQAPGQEYKMEIQPNGQLSCTFDGSVGHATIQNGPRLDDGVWHTVECTKEDTTVTLTIDGISWTKTVTIGSISNSNDLVIGAYPAYDFYKGDMDNAYFRAW